MIGSMKPRAEDALHMASSRSATRAGISSRGRGVNRTRLAIKRARWTNEDKAAPALVRGSLTPTRARTSRMISVPEASAPLRSSCSPAR
jgi:hypothetical protein